MGWEPHVRIIARLCIGVCRRTLRGFAVGQCLSFLACLCGVLVLSGCARQANVAKAHLVPPAYPPQRCIEIVARPAAADIGEISAVISWDTDVDSPSVVRYGTSPFDLTEFAEQQGNGTHHWVRLVNLKPHTSYYFRVESACHGRDAGINPLGTFTTGLDRQGANRPQFAMQH
jgi:hypothetical protein